MEEILCFLGFTVGATVTIGAMRALRGGLRSTAVKATRGGLGVRDALRRVGEEARKIGDEARAELQSEGEQPPAPPRRAKRGKDIRTIEIAPQ